MHTVVVLAPGRAGLARLSELTHATCTACSTGAGTGWGGDQRARMTAVGKHTRVRMYMLGLSCMCAVLGLSCMCVPATSGCCSECCGPRGLVHRWWGVQCQRGLKESCTAPTALLHACMVTSKSGCAQAFHACLHPCLHACICTNPSVVCCCTPQCAHCAAPQPLLHCSSIPACCKPWQSARRAYVPHVP